MILTILLKRSSTHEIFCPPDFFLQIFAGNPHPRSSVNIPQENKPHANDLEKKMGRQITK